MAATAAGDITTSVNKGRWVGPMSSLLFLDVYDVGTFAAGSLVMTVLFSFCAFLLFRVSPFREAAPNTTTTSKATSNSFPTVHLVAKFI